MSVLTLPLAGCGTDTPTDPATRLEGIVLRGPTQPICLVDDPCEEPFAAGFTLRRNGFLVTRFESDAEGRFSVAAAPGDYVVVPDADAPILGPASQERDVTLGAGVTTVELHFDTGIR
ncbi:MAG: hypothetical protein PVF05_09080 [Gemmatimonadales bacterium]